MHIAFHKKIYKDFLRIQVKTFIRVIDLFSTTLRATYIVAIVQADGDMSKILFIRNNPRG